MTHPKLVDTMSRPDFYPHRPEQVELIQTHISYIFIAGKS
jgi:aminoglycoside phosphotransferase family enzyme